MTLLSFLSISLCLVMPQAQSPSSNNDSSISVISFKWSKARRTIDSSVAQGTSPMREIIPATKPSQRNARANDPMGVRDPNEDTLDGRSAALEKSVQEARAPSQQTLDGFLYHAKVHNAGPKTVEILFWEYQIRDSAKPDIVSTRQFFCGAKLRPDKDKVLEGFSLANPYEVVSVDTLGNKNSTTSQEGVVINRVEYSDGSSWQRKDWNFQAITASYQRLFQEPLAPGVCKAL